MVFSDYYAQNNRLNDHQIDIRKREFAKDFIEFEVKYTRASRQKH